MGVINPQMAQSQMLYQGRPGLVNPHKGNPNVPVPPLDPGLVPNGLYGPLVPTQSGQPPSQLRMSGPSKLGGKEGEGELNAPLNPAGSAPITGPLHNSAPPMNSQRQPTTPPTSAPAEPSPGPGPMGDPSFDMTTCLAALPDLDSGPSSSTLEELWYKSTVVYNGSSAPAPPVPGPGSMGDFSFDMTTCLEALPDLDSGPSPSTLEELEELWYKSTAVHKSLPAPTPRPGPDPMGDLFDNMFDNTGGDFDFATGPLSDMELWFDSAAIQHSWPALAPPTPGPRLRRDVQSPLTAVFGSTGGDFDFCPGSLTDTKLWLGPTAVHNGSPAPPPPAPGPGSMGELFDMTDMFANTGGDFDFGTGPLSDMELWFDPAAVQAAHDGSMDMK
jgi:hypothetical protein